MNNKFNEKMKDLKISISDIKNSSYNPHKGIMLAKLTVAGILAVSSAFVDPGNLQTYLITLSGLFGVSAIGHFGEYHEYNKYGRNRSDQEREASIGIDQASRERK